MFSIGKSFGFDAAHRLFKHSGKCFNLHGHTYRIEVHLASDTLSENDMIVDFAEIKGLLKGWIDHNLDHGVILNKDDTGLIDFCIIHRLKYYLVSSGDPTAEMLSKNLFDIFRDILARFSLGELLIKVIVFETRTCHASCSIEKVQKS